MGHLASIGFNGDIDWCFEWDTDKHCVALQELSHADNAVALVTSIALDHRLMHHNDGWAYTWLTQFGMSCGQTMLKGAYLMDATFEVGDMRKTGWRLVMPMLNTSSMSNVMHHLPRNVAAWNANLPMTEQVA